MGTMAITLENGPKMGLLSKIEKDCVEWLIKKTVVNRIDSHEDTLPVVLGGRDCEVDFSYKPEVREVCNDGLDEYGSVERFIEIASAAVTYEVYEEETMIAKGTMTL